MNAARRTVVVSGALAQRPRVGGHAWVFLNWLLGLRSLGFEVLFLDRLEPSMLHDPALPPEQSSEWQWLRAVMTQAGFDDEFALLYDRGRVCLGLERSEVVARARRAELLFDFMGYLDDEDVRGAVDRRVFVDIDPGFPQLWRAHGLHDAFDGHEAFVTVGLGIGRPDCHLPDAGLPWVTTLPPVAMDHWPVVERPRRVAVTSVCTWRGPFAPVEHRGARYGLRAHEFRRFAPLPRLVAGGRFELALDIDPADARDIALLRAHGWHLVDPAVVARDPWSYRQYLQCSSAELQVAKEMYVRSRSGWFSDRSACYLASGRPVVAQETGVGIPVPTGEGFLTFATLDEAADALGEVIGNEGRHAKAARDLAVDCFDARKVLRSVLAHVAG